MSIEEERELRRRMIYVSMRMKASGQELKAARERIGALKEDEERDHREFVYTTMHAKYLREERTALAAEYKELKEKRQAVGS